MWLIEKIKAWRERRMERKIKKIEQKYGVVPDIVAFIQAPMVRGREYEYVGGKTRLLTDLILEKERKLAEELENDPKLCFEFACMQEQRRQQEILNDERKVYEAMEKSKRIWKEYHPGNHFVYCEQRPEGHVSNFGGLPSGNFMGPQYDTSKLKEIYENDSSTNN